ncbi:MAG: peroxiredoxin [Nocardioidaceae bacterium]
MTLALGRPAPDFALRDQHGQTATPAQLLGRNVVIIFYPFAFSGVCTGELQEVRDSLADLDNDSSAVLAISCDSMFTLRVFAEREGLAFPLLSDFWPHGATSRAYDVFDEQLGRPDRSTVVLDREGLVRWQVTNEVSQARDVATYKKVLTELG